MIGVVLDPINDKLTYDDWVNKVTRNLRGKAMLGANSEIFLHCATKDQLKIVFYSNKKS